MKIIWENPKEITSLNKYVKTGIIEEQYVDEFFNIWKSEKNEDIKNSGFSIKKYNNKWQLNYWTNEDDIENINKECEELCKKYGFLDNKKEVINKKIQEIINILDKYNNENLLDELKLNIVLKLNDIKMLCE